MGNEEYTAVMRRFTSRGSMSMWDRSHPSVWLTAWCLKIFRDVSFQDWEDFIFVDPSVFDNSVLWLINHQNPEGEFFETLDHQESPIHHAIKTPANKFSHSFLNLNKTSDNIALTAHVLIALDKVAPAVTGSVKKYCSTARHRATKFLEKTLAHIHDPYVLAITAYALAMVRSSDASLAYGKLLT